MDIPSWSKRYFKPQSVQRIEDAIKAAEQTTSGEIVPMVVRRSSTVGHVPLLLMSLMVAVLMVLDGPGWQHEHLGAHWIWYLVDAVALLLLSAVFAKLPFIQRILTSRHDQSIQVDMRAELEFYESNIHKTRDTTGILLFVSLMEHRALVLADEGIAARVPNQTWDEVCNIMLKGIKEGDLEQGLRAAIERSGQILAAEFPAKPNDTNELYDTLVLKE